MSETGSRHDKPADSKLPTVRTHPLRAGLSAVAITGASMLPVSLLGALVVQMREDIAISTLQLGLVSGVFGSVSALLSIPAGRLVDRLGWMRSVWLGGMLLAIPLAAIATVVDRFWQIAVLLVMAGLGNAVAQPAANLAIIRGVGLTRQGLAFGVKQAAIPAGSLLAGIAVPVVALTVGWQWAFGIAALMVTALCATAPLTGRPPRRPRQGQISLAGVIRDRALLLLALGNLTSAMGMNALFVFTVDASVARGIDPATAGLLLAFGSGLATLSRLGVGWWADRRAMSETTLLATMAGMAALGAPGLVLLGARGDSVSAVALGLGTAIGFGFAWSGIFNLVVTRTWSEAPAAATGVTQSGLWIGGTFGPLLFGLLAASSYALAFYVSSGFVLCAACCLLAARGLLLARARA